MTGQTDAVALLHELYAIVKGECPRLLNEDSGGNGALAIQIDKALSAPLPAPQQAGAELSKNLGELKAPLVPDKVGDGAVAWRTRLVDTKAGVTTLWKLHHFSPSDASLSPDITIEVQALGVLAPAGGGGQELGAVASLLPTEREVRLVLAARAVAFGDHFSPAAIKELDAASEAYAADVPWEDEPEQLCICVTRGDGPEGCGICNETAAPSPETGEGS